MATQQFAVASNRRIARRLGRCAPLVALLAVLVLIPAGGQPRAAHAAPANSPSCPTWYNDGAAQCQGQVTQYIPGTIQPPGLVWPGTWMVCVTRVWMDLNYPLINEWLLGHLLLGTPPPPGWPNWTGGWLFQMQSTGSWPPSFLAFHPFVGVWTVNDPALPLPAQQVDCPPAGNPPPCTTCVPQFQFTSWNIWAYAPVAVVAGKASCPGNNFNGTCPPSVGNEIDLWVDHFNNVNTSVCQDLGTYGGLYNDLTICMQWRLQVGSLTWNFDDEEVDPITGQGKQAPGVNINVQRGGIGSSNSVSHVFQYSSAYDPLRGCVRPCQGEMRGPTTAQYPAGTPAFQVTVSSNWWLWFGVCANQQACQWNIAPLRQLGASQDYFTSVTTVPVPVFSYGSVTTP